MNLNNIAEFGLETISTQDGKFVDEALLLIDQIRDRREFYNVAGKDVYTNDTLLRVVKQLETLISKRFKLTTQFLYHGVDVMGYFKVLPNEENGLDEGYRKVMDKMMKSRSASTEYNEDEFRRTSNALKSLLSKQQESLVKYAKKNPIVVDRKNATITGVPKDIVHFIAVDWEGNLFKKCTPREYLAVLIHEVGHMFTYHEYSNKHVQNTTVVIEAFKKIKNPKEFEKAVTVVSEQLDIKIDKNTDKKETVVRMAKGMISVNKDNVRYYKDAEMLADQFASRFGLADALTSALTKFTRGTLEIGESITMYRRINMMITALFLGIICGGPALAIIYIGLSLAITAIFTLLVGLVIVGVFSSDGTKMPYDSMIDRVKRLKQDVIRQIGELENSDREGTELKDMIRELLAQIDNMSSNLHYLTSKRDFAPILGNFLFHRGTSKYSLMEKDIESLEANPMIAMKHKLKQLGER